MPCTLKIKQVSTFEVTVDNKYKRNIDLQFYSGAVCLEFGFKVKKHDC
jgi:hypothetical protein